MTTNENIATVSEETANDLFAGQSVSDENQPEMSDNTFADDFDLFGEDMGGNDSGVEALYRRKFNAGINENVKFLGLEWLSDENYKMIRPKFENDDQWEESFPMFVPEVRTYTNDKGVEITTWFPKKMFDANKMPIEDNSQYRRRSYGGVKVTDENGRALRDQATNKVIYRNETEAEAQKREMLTFKLKLNSFLACFCKNNIKEAMTLIQSKGRVTGWKDYMERVMEAINTYCPNYAEELVRLKLHRKYDKTTSNKRSEKYFQLPETMEYGLFMEKMCVPELSVITTTNYEDDKLIAAPQKRSMGAGVQNSPNNGMPTPAATGMPAGAPMGGMPMGGGLPSASAAMPPINRG